MDVPVADPQIVQEAEVLSSLDAYISVHGMPACHIRRKTICRRIFGTAEAAVQKSWKELKSGFVGEVRIGEK